MWSNKAAHKRKSRSSTNSYFVRVLLLYTPACSDEEPPEYHCSDFVVSALEEWGRGKGTPKSVVEEGCTHTKIIFKNEGAIDKSDDSVGGMII